jgi:preprotein translocase subunit SecA
LFYLSLEDDLMRMFASDRVASIMGRLKWPDDEPIAAKMVTRAVENAQKQIEELNYERRKNVVKYDDVMNTQRTVIYGERQKILEGHDLGDESREMVGDVVGAVIETYCPAEVFPEEWDVEAMHAQLVEIFPVTSTVDQLREVDDGIQMQERILGEALDAYAAKEQHVGSNTMRELERMVLLNIIDTKWREHLYEMDYLQEGIHLRAYGQKDPLTEYQREAFTMFEELTQALREDFVRYIYRVELVRQDEAARSQPRRVQENRSESDGAVASGGADPNSGAAPQAVSDKVPRNAPCPCGSGKKYKKCHGATA